MQLRIPGPTPVPPEVLQAGAQQMINHRGTEFAELIARITSRLQELFATKNDLYILTSSGTGALEASIVNTLSPGDQVLGVTVGEFGERYVGMAKAFGADLVRLEYEHGVPADPDDIRKALQANPAVKAVLITHNETSTGVTNDIATIGGIVREFDKLFLVDSVSGIGSLPYPVDEWGGDVVSTCSQKGWMAPPGIAMISISAKGWEYNKVAKMPRAYWDLAASKSYLARGQTPWTPAVSVLYSMDKGLELMMQEGLAGGHARHARIAGTIRQGVKDMGLQLLVQDEKYASNTVTAIRVPDGVDAGALLRTIRADSDIELATGQGPLAGKIFRIGHLGWITDDDARIILDGVRAGLAKVGYKAGVAASR